MTTSSPPAADENDQLPPLESYAKWEAAAKQVRGVSLWQDAWRRLVRNRPAITALGFIVLVAGLALFTPLLPLQSPRATSVSQRMYEPPELWPKSLRSLGLAELSRPLPNESAAERQGREARYQSRRDELFGELSYFDQALVAVRLAVAGDYCLPSWCGTDGLGRDLLARICWGARISLAVGIVATLVSLLIGVTYGATAGYVGGVVGDGMMRFVDVLDSIPFIFIVIFLVTILGEPAVKVALAQYGVNQLVIFFLVIGAVYWLTMARVVRGQVLSLKNEAFVEAAQVIGGGRTRIIFRHIIPNVASIVIVYLTLTIPSVILFEAFLSFIGLGVEAPDVSWGILASDGIRVLNAVRTAWWLVLFPDAMLAATLFALNFLGDGLRDALDPRLRHRT